MTLSALSLLLALSAPKVDLTVDIKDGEVITGERLIRVIASAPNSYITQVEFYVGPDLRDSDTSTPYEFKIDSLAEADGPLKLRFKAYADDGSMGEKTVTVKIDNGLSKGLDFHLAQAEEAVSNGRYKDAITSGRLALKIDDNSVAARIVLARANLALNQFDLAQKFAEDAVEKDPKSQPALDLVAATKIRQAFSMYSRAGTTRMDTINGIRDALKVGVEARQKSLDLALEALGSVNDSNLQAYADTAIRGGRYTIAIAALSPAFDAHNDSAAIANRLALTQIRAGRITEAVKTMQTHKRYGKPDAYGWALISVLEAVTGHTAESDEAMKEALLADSQNIGVRTASAYLALRQNRAAALSAAAQSAAQTEGQRPEVLYYLSAVANRSRNFADGRRFFERAILAEPLFESAYLEAAHQALSMVVANHVTGDEANYLYESAKSNYMTALAARPESSRALSGLALVAMYQNNAQDALKYADAAVKANPNDAGAFYARSGAYSKLVATLSRSASGTFSDDVNRYGKLAQADIDQANRLDPTGLGGRGIPRENDLLLFFTLAGRPIVIAAP